MQPQYEVSCIVPNRAASLRLLAELRAAGFPDTRTAAAWGELRMNVTTTDAERLPIVHTILAAGGATSIAPPGPVAGTQAPTLEERVHATASSDTLPAAGLHLSPAPAFDLGGESG
jgi:hypothetical protein